MIKYKLLFVFLIACCSVYAQQAIGEWRSYPAYGNITAVSPSSGKVFAVSLGNLFSYDTEDSSLELYTQENGLSDVLAQLISYDQNSRLTVITYANSNIDLIDGSKLYNIPDLKNKPMISSKVINDIYFSGKYAYLSTDFGIIQLNLEKKEIADTYTFNMKVLNTIIVENTIYALTEGGIYIADTNDNLLDFNNWEVMDERTGKKLLFFNNQLYLLQAGYIYKRENNATWVRHKTINAIDMFIVDNKLIYYVSRQLFEYDPVNGEKSYALDFSLLTLRYSSVTKSYWAGVSSGGLYSFNLTEGGGYEVSLHSILPDGPMTNNPFSMSYNDGRLIVAGGGRWRDREYRAGAIMFFEDNDWYSFNADTVRKQAQAYVGNTHVRYRDIINVVVDPKDRNHIYAGSYGDGLYEFKDKQFVKLFNAKNSELETILDDSEYNYYNYVRVDALSFDQQGNLWMSNNQIPQNIKVLKTDSTWLSFNYTPISEVATFSQIYHISNGQKWITIPRNKPGLFIIDINSNLEDQSKHKTVFFQKFTDTEGNEISTSGVFSVVEDKKGTIWVGTDKGPMLFPNPKRVFDSDFRCTRVKVPLEDPESSEGGTVVASFLLENEQLNCILIDGGNRKWIGTESNGVYLLSEDGKKTIHHFTTENSPLPSDRILSMAINPETGEVFIGTESGLVSYMADATEGKDNYNNIEVFPNPVRPDYDGLITVRGLEESSEVVITDIQGRRVYKAISIGGEITWDGKDFNYQKVSTGVYLVMAATSDGKKGIVAKIVVVK